MTVVTRIASIALVTSLYILTMIYNYHKEEDSLMRYEDTVRLA